MESEAYPGTGILEIMDSAVIYNRFLYKLVEEYALKGDRILDFGAGSGQFATLLTLNGYNVVCFEPDLSLRQSLAHSGLEAHTSLNLVADGSIDYVYSLNVLEHIADDIDALRMIYTKLRPRGRLLLYVPALQWLYTSFDLRIGHVRRYNKLTLCDTVKTAGFNIERSCYADSLGVLASLIYKLLGSPSRAFNDKSVRLYDRIGFPMSLMLDRLLRAKIGKNLFVVACRP
jgi:hypothetical protein